MKSKEKIKELVFYEGLGIGGTWLWIEINKEFLIDETKMGNFLKRFFHFGIFLGSFFAFEFLPAAHASNQKVRNKISGSHVITVQEIIENSLPQALPKRLRLGKGQRLGSKKDFPRFIYILIDLAKSPTSINQQLKSFPVIQSYPVVEKFGIFQPIMTQIILPSNMRKMISLRGGFVVRTILNPTTLISGVLFMVAIILLKKMILEKINWTQLREKIRLAKLTKHQKMLLTITGLGIVISIIIVFLFLRFKKPFPIGEPQVFLEPESLKNVSFPKNNLIDLEIVQEEINGILEFIEEGLPELHSNLKDFLKYSPHISIAFQRLARELFLLARNESHSKEKIKELIDLLSNALGISGRLILRGIQPTVDELVKNNEL